jgi:hypothetical protein
MYYFAAGLGPFPLHHPPPPIFWRRFPPPLFRNRSFISKAYD